MKPIISEISPTKVALICEHVPQVLEWEGENQAGFSPFVVAAEAYVLSTWNGNERVVKALEAAERGRARPDFAVIPSSGE